MLKILYATDGGEPAIAALSLLEKVAQRHAVEITALSVVGQPADSEEDVRRADETGDRRVGAADLFERGSTRCSGIGRMRVGSWRHD